jgi:histidyl-tRNA synthetase
MSEFEILKGTKDYLFDESLELNKILNVIKTNLERNGFNPFKTPTIEYFKTLAGKYDEDAEIVSEIFKVKDRGDRNLGLRYDLTVPLCRFIAQNSKSIKFPFKRYEVGNVFRDGPIKTGRLREFIQFDFDIVGEKRIEAEAELLLILFDIYNQLKINCVIEINNNKILRGVLFQVGFEEKDLQTIILSIDKLKKIGFDNVIAEIKEKGFDEEKSKEAVLILMLDNINEIKKKAKNKMLLEGIEELEIVYNLIYKKTEVKLNFSLARGLNIYTGNIWEVYEKNEIITSSLGGGGRYDNVIGEFICDNKEYPSFGFSFGIVPIIEVLKKTKKLMSKKSVTEILIVPLKQKKEILEFCFDVKNKLIKEEKNCEINYDYKLKKAFSYCESYEVPNICIIGENEVESKIIKIKNLKTGKEKEIVYK